MRPLFPTVTVNCPPPEVFEHLMALERHGEVTVVEARAPMTLPPAHRFRLRRRHDASLPRLRTQLDGAAA